MRKLTTTLCLTLAVFLGSVGMSESGNFVKGSIAYDSGDYATALSEWKPLAEQGNASAQYSLGLMYKEGRGVIQDNVYAHMWFNIAASSGGKLAVENRDIVAKEMTPSQLEKAQDLARECVRKKYKAG